MALKTPLIPDEPGDFPISRFATFDYQRDPERFFALDASERQGPQTSLNGHDAWQIVPHRLNHASCPRLVEGHSILHYRIYMYSIYIYIYTYIYYHVLEFFCLVCQSPKLTTLEAVVARPLVGRHTFTMISSNIQVNNTEHLVSEIKNWFVHVCILELVWLVVSSKLCFKHLVCLFNDVQSYWGWWSILLKVLYDENCETYNQ